MTRDELFGILKSIFHPANVVNQIDAVFSLVNENAANLTTMQAQVKECEDKIFHWLGLFDSQVDDEGRQNICNSVTLDFVIDPAMVQLANPNNEKIF